MFESVMGILFFFFFSFLIMSNDSKEKKYKQEMNTYLDSKKEYENKVIDERLEHTLRNAEYSVAVKEADEALLEMFKTPERVEQFKRNYRSKDVGYVERVYLAKRGKLCWKDARYGMWFDCLRDYRHDISAEECDQFAKDCRTFALWMDRQLKQHGVRDMLYFGRGGNYFCPAYSADWTYGNTYQWDRSIIEGRKLGSHAEMVRKTKEHFPGVK